MYSVHPREFLTSTSNTNITEPAIVNSGADDHISSLLVISILRPIIDLYGYHPS